MLTFTFTRPTSPIHVLSRPHTHRHGGSVRVRTWHIVAFHVHRIVVSPSSPPHPLPPLSLNKAVAMCKMLLLKSPCCNYILFYSCWGFLYSHGDLFIPCPCLAPSRFPSRSLYFLSAFSSVLYACGNWWQQRRAVAEEHRSGDQSLGIHEIHAWFLLSCCVHIKSCLCMFHSCPVSLWRGIATSYSYSYKLQATCPECHANATPQNVCNPVKLWTLLNFQHFIVCKIYRFNYFTKTKRAGATKRREMVIDGVSQCDRDGWPNLIS